MSEHLSANGLDGACVDLARLVHGIPVAPLNPDTDREALGWILDRLGVSVVVAGTDALAERAERAPGAPPHVALVLDPGALVRGATEARLDEALAAVPGEGRAFVLAHVVPRTREARAPAAVAVASSA